MCIHLVDIHEIIGLILLTSLMISLKDGIFFWQGPVFHTFSHSDTDLEKTLDSVYKSMKNKICINMYIKNIYT